MKFLNPVYLILLMFIPVFIYLHKHRDKHAGLHFSNIGLLYGLQRTVKQKFAENLIFLRVLSLVVLIIALARPQLPVLESKIRSKGIDIILALDISTSMLAEDFIVNEERRNRLDVVKQVAEKFIGLRKNDRIGLVAFAGRAYTVCPLTLDYDWLLKNLDRVRTGLIEDGTALGSCIAASLNRLRSSTAKSKIIIMLTDGVNNTGKITPIAAAKLANSLKVKVYTVGAGTEGLVPYPVVDMRGKKTYRPIEINLDEEELKNIAIITRANYYRATDTDSLKRVFTDINRLERADIEETAYQQYRELSLHFIGMGIIILLFEAMLSNTILRRVP